MLGDNIYYGHDLSQLAAECGPHDREGATVFAYHVHDPERYGVVAFDEQGKADRASRRSRHPAEVELCGDGALFLRQPRSSTSPTQ